VSCNITGEALQELKHTSDLLTFLRLSNNKNVTDAGLQNFTRVSGLTSLNIKDYKKVTDAGL